MKDIAINFFSPEDNLQQAAEKKVAKKVVLTGYISTSGKLVFPFKTTEGLEINANGTYFKIGIQQGKRKVKSLYLIPTENEEGAFPLEKASKSYFIALALILQKCGITYSEQKYTFEINQINYNGISGYQLTLNDSSEAKPKVPYTGKPRGRKPKSQVSE